jgi:hypothetical protein
MKTSIGAEKFILWIRNEKIADNATTRVIGRMIFRVINEYGGKLTVKSQPCIWTNFEVQKFKVDKYGLPKTATLYELEIKSIELVYKKIFNHFSH